MPQYITNEKEREKPVLVTMTMEHYYGGPLPTIKIEGISVAHFLPDGRLAVRDELSDLDRDRLIGFGIAITSHSRTEKNKGSLATVLTSQLVVPK